MEFTLQLGPIGPSGLPTGVGPPISALQPGRVLLMEVLSLAAGEAKVRLAGQVLTARGSLPPTVGTFWVRMEQAKPTLVELKLIAEPCAAERRLADVAAALGLRSTSEVDKLVRTLVKWRLPLQAALARRFLNEAENVPQEERALFWEARAWLETLSLSNDPQKLANALSYLLHHADARPEGQAALNQALSLIPGQESVRFFSFRAREGEGELYVLFDRKEGAPAEESALRLVLRFSIYAWGEVWVGLTLAGKNITAHVYSSDPTALELAESAQKGLAARLERLGFQLVAFRVSRQSIGTVLDFLSAAQEPQYQGLDVSV